MRRIEPKRELKHYESEGSAIRRIMNEKLVTHHDRGVDTPHYQATMKKQGKVKLRKSGDYDDHGTHTVYASPEDVQKYMAKGYKKVPMDEDNYQATMKGHMKDRDKKDKAAGMVKLRKDDDGIHTVTVKQADVQSYMAKGYKRVPIGEDSADESLWANIHKKRARIKAGSGEKMRKKGEKGAPTPDQIQRAQEEYCCEDCEHMAEGLEIEDALILENGEKKNVKLNKPQRTPGGPKKFAVYVRNEKGNIVKVTFGDPNLSIKRDDPDRRRAFRARHNCADPGPKTKARYWSCRNWRASAKVGEEVEESINIIEEKIPSKLMTLLRMGLVEKGELETMKRALKSGEDALTQPVLRKHIYELFNKLVDAVSDDQQIYVRMRKRLQTDNKEEE